MVHISCYPGLGRYTTCMRLAVYVIASLRPGRRKQTNAADPQPGFKVWGEKTLFGGKVFVFIICQK